MIKPYQHLDTQGFDILTTDSRLVQLHNLRVKHHNLAYRAIRKKTKDRHQALADKVKEHMLWFVKKLIPTSGEWVMHRLPSDSKGRFVLLYLGEET